MRFSHNISKIIALSVFSVFIFSGCQRGEDGEGRERRFGRGRGAAAVQEAPVFAVNTSFAVQGPIQDHIALSGDIIAGSSVDTFSDIAGRISRVHVSIGQRVTAGQPIVAVDPSRPGMTFMESIVRAPVSGTITALPAQLGMTITQATPLARIAAGAALEIRLHVAERFISRIVMNQLCEITLDAWPGEVFIGSISEISPTVDVASRTMEIKVNVHNPDARLRPGMFARVRIITERRENIVKVPASAVVSRFGEQFVFAVDRTDPDSPVVRQRTIVPGLLVDGIMEIQHGLAPNEEFVIRGQSLLADGSRVNIIEQIAPIGGGV